MDEQPDTSTTFAARDHARAQAARRVAHQPTVPARDANGVVDRTGADVAADRMLWDDVVPPGGVTSRVLPRGAVVRLTDLDGDACANVLVYNAGQPRERLNVADTVKVQWQAYLGAGSLLLSDMGRVLMTVLADTSGSHDALCGASNAHTNEASYGSGGVHGPHPNARDRFAVALAKHGLDRRDLVPNVNFFQGVSVADDGALRLPRQRRRARRLRRAARRVAARVRGGRHAPRARSPSRVHRWSATRRRRGGRNRPAGAIRSGRQPPRPSGPSCRPRSSS